LIDEQLNEDNVETLLALERPSEELVPEVKHRGANEGTKARCMGRLVPWYSLDTHSIRTELQRTDKIAGFAAFNSLSKLVTNEV
jgi:hypothetical protein